MMQGHRTYLDLMKRPYTRGRALQAPRKPGHRQFSYPMRHLAKAGAEGLQAPARGEGRSEPSAT